MHTSLLKTFTNFILHVFEGASRKKMTFSFMLLFSWYASLDHHFMHYLYSFYGKADLYWKLGMKRIQMFNHTSYALEKSQRNDKQIRVYVKDTI